jgi:lipopolysaccharide transport system permease protein
MFGFRPDILGFIFFPIILIEIFLCTAGVGLFFSALNVKYRDVRFILTFFVQLMFFVTPVMFASRIFSDFTMSILFLNPIGHIIDGFRSMILQGQINPTSISIGFIFSTAVFFLGANLFKMFEKSFSDVI